MFQWVDKGLFQRVLDRESLYDLYKNNKTSTDRKCANCGFHFDEDDDFCRMCGTRVREPQLKSQK